MQHRYRALTIRWFDWNYNILLLELINSNNNCIEFSCHSFFLFFFLKSKTRVSRLSISRLQSGRAINFNLKALSAWISRVPRFSIASTVIHVNTELSNVAYNWMKSSCARATSRRLSKDKGVTRFRVLYSRRCSCNDTGDNRYIAVASSKSVCTVSCYQILKRRSNLRMKFYAYLIILQFLTFIVWNIVSFICTIIRDVIRDAT